MYTAYSQGRGGSINGFKIRELFVRPHAHDQTFFYGVNFEFSVNYKYWESRRITSEVRPIVGLHLHPVDIIFNPIVDTEYTGGFGGLEFVPATRVAYNINDKWAAAVEEYSDDGPLRHFLPVNDQFHEVWAVMDRASKILSVETGVGFGVTAGADKLTLKLMMSRDLNEQLLVFKTFRDVPNTFNTSASIIFPPTHSKTHRFRFGWVQGDALCT